MAESVRSSDDDPAGYITFRATGEAVKGEFHCSECGYGVTVYRTLPVCPMCGGTAWEAAPWSPLSRAFAESTSLDERVQIGERASL